MANDEKDICEEASHSHQRLLSSDTPEDNRSSTDDAENTVVEPGPKLRKNAFLLHTYLLTTLFLLIYSILLLRIGYALSSSTSICVKAVSAWCKF